MRNAHTCSLTGRFATVPNSHLTSEKQSPGLFFLTPSALSGFDSLKIIKKIPNATAFGIFGGDEGKVRNAHTCSLTGRFATVPNSHLTSEKQSPGLFFLTPSALSGFDSLKIIKKIPNATAFGIFGGDEGNRTPDLLHAKQALYQLSYTPKGLNYHTTF